jgi:gas vesicle protein
MTARVEAGRREGVVDDRSSVLLGALLGAAVGGAVGFLFFTDRGRQMRADVGPRLNDLVDEARRLQGNVLSLRQSVRDGWGAVKEFAGDLADDAAPWAEHGPAVPRD